MPSIAIELGLILALIALNGALAMSEIALVSARKTRLQHRAEAGDAGAARALLLMKEPTRFLSTVQIGITLVGILAGAFGGATVAQQLEVVLATLPFVAPYAEPAALILVVVAIAYASLVLGEVVPKRVALSNPEGVSALMSRLISFLAVAAAPAVAVLSVSTDVVLRVLRVRERAEPAVTEADIRLLLAQGREEGVLHEAEHAMLERALALGDRRVGELMTPRPKVAWLDIAGPAEVMHQEIGMSPHTYLLVCRDDLDHVMGVVSAKELWSQVVGGRMPNLQAALSEPLYVPMHLPALSLLKLFSQPGPRIAVVLDEHGGVQGVITPIDVLEAIAGQLVQPDQLTSGPVQREDGSWLLDGLMALHELMELFDIEELFLEERPQYLTVGGLVMRQVGRVPRSGDAFEWHGLRFEVMDMDGRRVDKVLVNQMT